MLEFTYEVAAELVRIVRRNRALTRGCQVLAALVVTWAVWAAIEWLGRSGLAIAGRVVVAGRPLEQGLISFHVAEGRGDGTPVAGTMIRAGRYEIEAARGLPPGKYVVRIRSPQAPPETPQGGVAPPSEDRIPTKYNDDSTLFIEVSRFGRNRFDFAIP